VGIHPDRISTAPSYDCIALLPSSNLHIQVAWVSIYQALARSGGRIPTLISVSLLLHEVRRDEIVKSVNYLSGFKVFPSRRN
jgi:hypothetical protein